MSFSSVEENMEENDRMKFKFPFQMEVFLIDWLRENECLWNRSDENYFNKIEKAKVFQNFQKLLFDKYTVNVSVHDIKKKISNLRTIFFRELKNADRKAASQVTFGQHSRWAHFKALKFLKNSFPSGTYDYRINNLRKLQPKPTNSDEVTEEKGKHTVIYISGINQDGSTSLDESSQPLSYTIEEVTSLAPENSQSSESQHVSQECTTPENNVLQSTPQKNALQSTPQQTLLQSAPQQNVLQSTPQQTVLLLPASQQNLLLSSTATMPNSSVPCTLTALPLLSSTAQQNVLFSPMSQQNVSSSPTSQSLPMQCNKSSASQYAQSKVNDYIDDFFSFLKKSVRSLPEDSQRKAVFKLHSALATVFPKESDNEQT